MIVGRLLLAAGLLAAAAVTGFTGYIVWAGAGGERPSVCYGTAAKGRLEGGRRLPYAGANYRAYSLVGFLLGASLVGVVATGFALAAALLNAVFGLCLGCEAYLLIKRLTGPRVVPVGSSD